MVAQRALSCFTCDMKILCCGFFPAWQRTLELKDFRLGGVNRARRVVDSVGGKAANTARVLYRLGIEHLYLGFGGGETGQVIARMLSQEGIRHKLVPTLTPSRICQTILADDAGDFTELIEDALPPTDAEWQDFMRLFGSLVPDDDRIVLSGTLPRGVSSDIYAQLIELGGSQRILLDTSGDALRKAISKSPSIVKINESELCKSVAGDSLDERVYGLLAQGVEAVGVTRGGQYSMFGWSGKLWRIKVPEVDVVSTLGCGDSVNAGMVRSLAAGESPLNAFVYGLACGSSNAETALPGEIVPERVRELVSQIVIEQV
jgi:1-phosphofructokinase family hexose kinase